MGWAFWLYLGNNKLKSKRAIKPVYMDLPPYTEEIGNQLKPLGLYTIQRRLIMNKIRRMPKRFLVKAPPFVVDIFDNPQFADRYTIVFQDCGDGDAPYIAASAYPFHPLGIGLHGSFERHELSLYRKYQCKRRINWQDLPQDVQIFAMQHADLY